MDGQKMLFGHKGQFLHAYRLGLYAPSTDEYMEFTAPLPDYFEKALIQLRGRQESL